MSAFLRILTNKTVVYAKCLLFTVQYITTLVQSQPSIEILKTEDLLMQGNHCTGQCCTLKKIQPLAEGRNKRRRLVVWNLTPNYHYLAMSVYQLMKAVADVGMLGSVFQCSLCSYMTMEQVSSVHITAQLNQPPSHILKSTKKTFNPLWFSLQHCAVRCAPCLVLMPYI